MSCPHLCARPTTVPITGGREGGRDEWRPVTDDEFGFEYVQFEMKIDVQKVLEMY